MGKPVRAQSALGPPHGSRKPERKRQCRNLRDCAVGQPSKPGGDRLKCTGTYGLSLWAGRGSVWNRGAQ